MTVAFSTDSLPHWGKSPSTSMLTACPSCVGGSADRADGAADSVRMQLEVIARGTDWARTSGPMSIRLVDADGFQECDLVAKEARFGCIQHVVSGDYEVGAIEDVPGSECMDRVEVTLEITPDVEVPEMCFASTRVLEVERGCIASEGYEVGGTGRIEWRYEAVPDTCGEPRDEIVGFRTQFCCL